MEFQTTDRTNLHGTGGLLCDAKSEPNAPPFQSSNEISQRFGKRDKLRMKL
jgi:hypothetical protein